MKLLKQITLLILFLSIHFSIIAQINVCADKEIEIKERAKKIVDDYIQLVAFGEGEVEISHEITDISSIFYNYEEEFYFIRVTTLRTIEGEFDKASLNVTAIQENPELDFILKIEQIDHLIPEIKTQTIGTKKEIPNQPAREVKVVECTQTVKPLKVDLAPGIVFKKGQENTIEWEGGTTTDILVIDLVKFDKKGNIEKVINLAVDYSNTGYYPDWELDQKIKPGIYKIRLQKVGSNEEPVWSEEFRVKPKISTALKVGISVAVVGVAVALLWPDQPPPPPPDDLPGPPEPTR